MENGMNEKKKKEEKNQMSKEVDNIATKVEGERNKRKTYKVLKIGSTTTTSLVYIQFSRTSFKKS